MAKKKEKSPWDIGIKQFIEGLEKPRKEEKNYLWRRKKMTKEELRKKKKKN